MNIKLLTKVNVMKIINTALELLLVSKTKFLASKAYTKLMFFVLGIGSTLWFLVRVIPKPQRAFYPCMQAAAPLMSGFVVYLLTLGGITIFFKKAISKFKQAQYITASFALLISLSLLVIYNWTNTQIIYAKIVGFQRAELPDGSNNPMGTGFGVNPGRVVWVWNAEATNKACKNVIVSKGGWGNSVMDWDKSDAFIMPKNNNQDTINRMADNGLMSLTDQNTVKDAWDALFNDFNERKTGSASGYTERQSIFIKVNNGQAGWAINNTDLSERGNRSSTGVNDAAMANTTPATVVAIIRQLVDECEIPQENIYVGEPMTHVYKSLYDAIVDEYPNIVILDKENHSDLGRTKTSGWTEDAIFYSDKGSDMPDGIKDAFMNEMYNADYLINIPALKAHARGGVTMTAKNHFGSHGDHGNNDWGSFTLHDGLISTVDNDVLTTGVRGDYSMYRVLTDLMGHDKLGGNTILFVLDGLWGGIEATDMPVHWNMEPFNGDFPNSLFFSQDGVAVESVGLDFLRAEADGNSKFKDRPFFPAVDDHLHQAADKANWAEGFIYDPEADGTEMPSMGVHEHWNNATDKEYTRNLNTGEGIELVKIMGEPDTDDGGDGTFINESILSESKVYPNPCSESTALSFNLKSTSNVSIDLISADGKLYKVATNKLLQSGAHSYNINLTDYEPGFYTCRIQTDSNNKYNVRTLKLIIK